MVKTVRFRIGFKGLKMIEFFTGLTSKLRSTLSIIGAIAAAYIGYKLFSQQKRIKELEHEVAQSQASNVIKEKTGELNEIKKQTSTAKTKMDKSNRNYDDNKRILEQLRKNRPE